MKIKEWFDNSPEKCFEIEEENLLKELLLNCKFASIEGLWNALLRALRV